MMKSVGLLVLGIKLVLAYDFSLFARFNSAISNADDSCWGFLGWPWQCVCTNG